jgi:TonB family protein
VGSKPFDNRAEQSKGFSPPTPLSLVAPPYPSQSLFGGEVVLDVIIDSRGRLVGIRVVRGPSAFLDSVLSTVRTWSFFPARLDGQAVAARIGIAFQFSQSYEPLRTPQVHKYDEPLAGSPDRGALPVVTTEPQYATAIVGEGSVILYDLVGRQGQLTSVQVFRGSESLTPVVVAAVHQWRFVPGRRARTDTDSAVIVVASFRYSGRIQPIPQTK